MYRYVATRNRVHRVIVEGGKAFKVEQCNLDDVAFLHLDDIVPDGKHCAYCWAGWVEPSPEEQAATAAAKASDPIPADAKPVALVTSTRRMAAGVIAAAAALGLAGGILASSPDPARATPDLDALRDRLDALIVDVRVLSADVNGHTHDPVATSGPVVLVIPTAPPPVPTAVPTVPTSVPTLAPTTAPTPPAAVVERRTVTETRTNTIIVVQPTAPPVVTPNGPTPAPTAPPTVPPVVRVCSRPGIATGFGDACRWVHNQRGNP